MTTAFHSFSCAECGGAVELRRGPGRMSAYRVDLDLPVPEDFEIPTCAECGEQYLTVELGHALAEAQAPCYAAWQRSQVKPLIETIQRAHGVTLRQIEDACAVSRTYLSHVVNGTKEASRTLLNLLEAYAGQPQEFHRKLHKMPWVAPPPCWPVPRVGFATPAPVQSRDEKRVPIVVPAARVAAYASQGQRVSVETTANDATKLAL